MISKVDHIGIAVRSLDEAVTTYENLFGFHCEGIEVVESQGVRVAFFSVGEVHIELLEPTRDDSPIARYIAKNGEGIHHVAFATNDIVAQIASVASAGGRMIHEVPVGGAGGSKVAFVHPKSTHGVLAEFCEPASDSLFVAEEF
jgi:methylmalonyl-CoA/ethylmalonyl-CoA epimerase